MNTKDIEESVLDLPKESLDPTVWTKNESGEFHLTDDAQMKIQLAVDWLVDKYNVSIDFIHIIGSIASNTYSDESDIDVHIVSKRLYKDKEAEFNSLMKKDYKDNYVQLHQDDALIGTHQIELYVQYNEFKNMASAGCYDFINKMWLVGPDMKPTDYDPYSHLYSMIMNDSSKVFTKIGSIILKAYELAIVCKNAKDQKFIDEQTSELVHLLKQSTELFNDVKQARSVIDNPSSKEDALAKRSSDEWKKADSTFKLLGKFGYIYIMKSFAKLYKKIENGETIDDLDRQVILIIKDNFTNDKLLVDAEKLWFTDIDDGNQQDVRIWIDDLREAPKGYVWIKTVDDFIRYVDAYGYENIELIDTDHDAGKFQWAGGDYIKCFDYLEFIGAQNLKIRIHSANLVGADNIRLIIQKNGWTEITDDNINEGLVQNISLAALLAIPAVMPEKAIAAKIKEMPRTEVRVNNAKFQSAVQNFTDKRIGDFSLTNAINIAAWTLYGEAGNQDRTGKEAIASSIYNRAGGNAVVMLQKMLKPLQYSSWNPKNPWGLVPPKSDKDWKYRPPKVTASNRLEAASWKDCVDIATKMMTGQFKSTIGNRNSYLNPTVVAKQNPKVLQKGGWGYEMTNKKSIGDHLFGYLPDQDGFKSKTKNIAKQKTQTASQKIYVVKQGDSLWKIAKNNKTTVKALADKNHIDPNSILQLGQKLKV